MTDWRILQTFLSPKRLAVYEVQVDPASGTLRCTCPHNSDSRTCRHIKVVRARMEAHGGTYPLHVHAHSLTDYDLAESDPTTYRAFVLRHARIEVL